MDEEGTFFKFGERVTDEDRARAYSEAERISGAIADLHDELGRMPTGQEIQSRIDRRSKPRPQELTYEPLHETQEAGA